MGRFRKKKRKPHIAADLTTPEGRKRANSEMIWGDHGFLRINFTNLHRLSEEMWRSNQPLPTQIRDHGKTRGIRTIVNLRGVSTRGYYLLEADACEASGIDLVDYQVFSRDTPTVAAVLGTRDMFEQIKYPALLHCKSGADRAGLMSALYLIARQGQTVEQARGQLSFRYLHIKQGKTGMLDAFFSAALTAGANTPNDFYRWIENDYDRIAIKTAFMENRQRFQLDRLLGRE